MIVICFTLGCVGRIKNINFVNAVIAGLDDICWDAEITSFNRGHTPLVHNLVGIRRSGLPGNAPAILVKGGKVIAANVHRFTDGIFIGILRRSRIDIARFERGPNGASAPISIRQLRRKQIKGQCSNDERRANNITDISSQL